MAGFAAWTAVFSGDVSGFVAAVKGAETQVDSLDRAVQLLNVGTKALTTYAIAGAASLAAMAVPAFLAMGAISGFDVSLRRIIALGGTNLKNKMGEMSNDITSLAVKWGISSDSIAEGTVQFVKAGITQYDILTQLAEGAAKLARVNSEDFSKVADVIVYAYTLYGDQVKDINTLMENMQVAANIGIMDIEDLGTAFEYAGSAMKIAGIGYNEFLAVITTLSNIAQKSSQTLGTLINRLLVNGETFEEQFGLQPGSVLSEGKINLTGLITILSKLDDKYKATEIVAGLFGVRSVNTFNGIMLSSNNYLTNLAEINGEHDLLNKSAKDLSVSIDALKTSLMETILAPLKSEEVLKGMSDMLLKLRDSLTTSGLPEKVLKILMNSIDYLTEHGEELIDSINNLASSFLRLMPMLSAVASNFLSFLKIITDINPAILSFLATIYLIGRIIPITTVIRALGKEIAIMRILARGGPEDMAALEGGITKVGWASYACATVGIFALIGGFSLLISSKDPLVQALGVIAIAFGGLALALMLVNAFIPLVGPALNAIGIASAIAGAAVIGGLLYTSLNPAPIETTAGISTTARASSVTNDYSTNYNYTTLPTNTTDEDYKKYGA